MLHLSLSSAVADRILRYLGNSLPCTQGSATSVSDTISGQPSIRLPDFNQLYSRGECHCLLDARSATSTTKLRFRRLMSPPSGFTLVEKSPINALRIGFLEAVAPGSRFVHIIRDGVNVAHLIEQKAGLTRR